MKTTHTVAVFCTVSIIASTLVATNSLAALYGDPPDKRHAWQVHDTRREAPAIVAPGAQPGDAPADAIVLFDGTDLSQWEANTPEKGVPTKWRLVNGALESVKGAGYIRTRQSFGDCQLHVEWATPTEVKGNSQGRGNSGVFLMGLYEVQVLDCYNNFTYPDGQAGSVYGQSPPLVNVSRGPGQWQSYDIIFRQPRFQNGELVREGYLTLLHNGALVQDHWVLEGPTGHKRRTKLRPHDDKLQLRIQDHGNPVRFRNIWIRELPERSGGGLKGPLTDPVAVQGKRNEIAAEIRQEANATGDSLEKAQLLMESLAYESRPEIERSVVALLSEFLAPLKNADRATVEAKKRPILALRTSVKYLTGKQIVPADFPPLQALETLVRKHDLDPKRK